MRKFYLFLILSFLFFLGTAQAQVPKLLHYQGHVRDGQGIPLEGEHRLTFRLYAAEVGGNLLWTQDFPVTQVADGNFAVLLDVSTADPEAVDFDEPYWLSIEVDGDGEMTPRQQIASSAYSINSDTVDGIQASATARANTLLPLDANAKFPKSVLDIEEGPGGNFDADTVDGFHAEATAAPNTILPLNASAQVPLNAIPQGPASGLDADKLDGFESNQFFDRANPNHTGVQPPATISPQGSGSGLDADTVDGKHENQINADKVDGFDANSFLFSKIYSYGTSENSPTNINQSQMKMAFGRVMINGHSRSTITSLPFTSSSTFEVVCANDDNDSNLGKAQCKPTGGSTAEIYNTHPDPRLLHWIAIGY